MKDTTIKGNGKSSIIRAPSDMPATFEEWRQQLIAGNGYLDVVLNTDTTGANAGCDVVGTPLSKANLLDDTTKAALELDGADPTVNDALYALSQKGSPAECHVYADNGTTVTMTKGDTVLSAVASGGEAVLYPAELGDWSIQYTYGGSQKTKTYTLEVIGIVYVYPFVVGDTLNDTTWDNIAIVSKLGKAQDYWKVGDTKTVAVNGVNYQFQIIGFDHDTLTTKDGTRTKAGITFQMVDCLNTTYSMNGSNTNSGGWNGSTMRTSTMATLLNQLPAALKNVLKSVNKLSGTGGGSTSGTQTTHDKLFLLSEVEIFGTTTYSVPGEGTQYAYYKAGNSKVKKVNGSANYWWERSPYSGTADTFCCVSNDGNASFTYASISRGVSFGFCV
nr:MAG TPA: hypothetical protein [Caudoviricetes sp.]